MLRLRTRLRAGASSGAVASLSLDFLGLNQTLDPRITFSRGSNATLVDATGKLTYAPNNLLTFSEQFDNAAWNKVGATVTANATAAPNGTTTADALVEDGTTGLHYAQQFVTFANATTYVVSFYLKPSTRTWVQVLLPSAAFSGSPGGYFNLSGAGSLGTVSGSPIARTITALANGWYHISITATSTAAAGGNLPVVAATADNTNSYAGTNGATAVFLWGAQLEAVTYQTTPSTYNPTTVKNLLGYTQEFDNAAWTKSNATITANATTAPDGTLSADKLVENTASNYHYASQTNVTPVASGLYVGSVYVKAAENTFATVQVVLGGANATVGVNLSTGATTTPAGGSASVTSVGNGWYRVAIFVTTSATTAGGLYVYTATSLTNNPTYTGNGTSGIYIWGAQLSDSASLDPYVYNPVVAPTAAAYYGPRFNYDPVTLQPRGLLIEEQRANLLTYSEQFDNGLWPKSNATISTNAIIAPDGTTTADKIIPNNGVVGYVYRNTAVSSGSAAFSIYVKAAEWGFVRILFGGSFSPSASTYIRLSDGVVTSGSGFTAQNVGNGWYRITGSSTYASATDNTIYIIPTNSGSSDTNGNGTSGIYVWGGQMENASFATSYIPTVASTVTRSADVALMQGANFSSWYNQNEGTVFVQGIPSVLSGTASGYAISDGTTNNRILSIFVNSTLNGFVATGGSVQAQLQSGTNTANAVNKIAFAVKTNDFAVSVNGASVATDTSGSMPPVTLVYLGQGAGGSGAALNGEIQRIGYTPQRVPNYQVQRLST